MLNTEIMTIHELRIGDWVEVAFPGLSKNGTAYIVYNQRITRIISNETVCVGPDNEEWDIEHLRPIEITGDILEMNGFHYSHSIRGFILSWQKFSRSYIIRIYLSQSLVIIERTRRHLNGVSEYNGNCYYVHELQQMFRYAGIYDDLIELPENFRFQFP